MILPVYFTQILPVHVRIDLRRRDVGMPKHFLDRAQVRTAFEKVRRERMSQRVRRHVLRDARPFDVTAQDLPCPHPRERLTTRIQEKYALALTFLQLGSKLARVDRHAGDRGAADGNESLL